MSEQSPDAFGSNPFGGMPLFGDLARMMQTQGPLHWDAARQFAQSITAQTNEGNVDPSVRFAYERLVGLAEMHVKDVTGLELTDHAQRTMRIVPVTAQQWSQRSLDAYRPLFEHLATSLHAKNLPADEAAPTVAMLHGLMSMMSPVMLGMAAGSLVGHLAERSFGEYDLPIPRPPSDEIQVVAARIDAFGEDWSLAKDDLRLWVCVRELTSHAILRVPHIRAALTTLLTKFASTFRPDPEALTRSIEGIDDGGDGEIGGDPMAQIQQLFSRPEVLLGAASTPEQQALVPALDALVAAIVGTIDFYVDTAAARLIGPGSAASEAVRRRRLEPAHSDQFIEQLLGLRIGRSQVDRGKAFARGVAERDPDGPGLARLWISAENLPTPAEVDAPGLWLARLGFDS